MNGVPGIGADVLDGSGIRGLLLGVGGFLVAGHLAEAVVLDVCPYGIGSGVNAGSVCALALLRGLDGLGCRAVITVKAGVRIGRRGVHGRG